MIPAAGGAAGSSSGGPTNVGGTTEPPDEGGAPPMAHDRGRVQVRDGNLLTDKGTRLRGVTFGLDNNPAGLRFEPSLFAELAAQTGLNTFHAYVENSTQETGAHVDEVDELVESASEAGIYVILGPGGGPAGGSFNLEKLRSFWTFYAPRYAARTHVVYEVQNIPDTGCNVAYKPETLAMEREIYGLIRGFAPSTHVALLSFVAQPSGAVVEAALDALEGHVDWSKASVAFHGQPCSGQDNLHALVGVTRRRGIAALASEMTLPTSFEIIGQLEAERVGWLNFEWFVFNRDLSAFRTAHDTAGISWCPDFGKWPEDSETCSTP